MKKQHSELKATTIWAVLIWKQFLYFRRHWHITLITVLLTPLVFIIFGIAREKLILTVVKDYRNASQYHERKNMEEVMSDNLY